MTRLTRPLMFSLIAAGIAGTVAGSLGPATAADRETVAVLVAAPSAKPVAETVTGAQASAVTPVALANRPAAAHRAPTLNHQRPLNEDLARFTRAF